MLVQIPNSHSLRLKTVNNSVTGVQEITPELSSLSSIPSLKLFVTQMHDHGFGLIRPRHADAWGVQNAYMQDYIYIYASTTWRVTSSVPMQYTQIYMVTVPSEKKKSFM